ncbi:MAG: apolipoprotein N-acyltransferase [Thermoanaerobaculales bacterium]|nr:apolipoprotein N-acyltransferase [Thermoanaerobaculales bacterium]
MTTLLPWILAAASGLALALAMPGPGLWPLLPLAPILLLEALQRARGRLAPWLLGWLAGTVFWSVTTNWVVPVMHHYGGLPRPLAVGCLIGMGAILGSLWALAAGLSAAVAPASRIWLFPAAWVAAGVLQRFPPFGFTWTGPAAALVEQPLLMRTLPVWGATGLEWAVLAAGAGLWGLLHSGLRLRGALALAAAGAGAFAAATLSPAVVPAGEPLTVAVIQPGTTLEQKWDPAQAQEIADRVWSLTAEAAVLGAELVLWPESAVPYRIDTDPAFRATVERYAAELGIEIVLNAIGATPQGGYANSAYLVTPQGVSPVRYDKIHLVPFGEYVPSWARLAFADSLVREVGAFSPGREAVLLPAGVPLGVAICFEVVFPGHAAAQARAGAELLVTLTNDGWYGYSWAPHQHLAQVRLRAAETGRWFARAALTGISGFVGPGGEVAARLEVGEHGVLVQAVQPRTGLTPRSRLGDWWAALCAVAAAVLVLRGRRGLRASARKRSNVQR